MSKLIDALCIYAAKSARASWAENPSGIYSSPCLASWDALEWFELVRDWELVDFLTSDTGQARRLVRSLQSCLQWRGQVELDAILARMSVSRVMNWLDH